MLVHLQSERTQLAVNHRCKRILDASVKDLRARRHNADLHFSIGQDAQQRLRSRRLTHFFHNTLVDDERNHAHPRELRPCLHGEMLCNRRNHHIRDVIHRIECILIHLEHTRHRRSQLDLAFLRLARRHIFTLADIAQNRRRIVLVQHILAVFPDIDMLLAESEQDLDILRTDHIALAKTRPLALTTYNLRDIVAEHHPHGILNTNLLHSFSPVSSTVFSKTRRI